MLFSYQEGWDVGGDCLIFWWQSLCVGGEGVFSQSHPENSLSILAL